MLDNFLQFPEDGEIAKYEAQDDAERNAPNRDSVAHQFLSTQSQLMCDSLVNS